MQIILNNDTTDIYLKVKSILIVYISQNICGLHVTSKDLKNNLVIKVKTIFLVISEKLRVKYILLHSTFLRVNPNILLKYVNEMHNFRTIPANIHILTLVLAVPAVDIHNVNNKTESQFKQTTDIPVQFSVAINEKSTLL